MRQLERELASTVSALRDERRDKRAMGEALRAKLGDAKSAAREREADTERCVVSRHDPFFGLFFFFFFFF